MKFITLLALTTALAACAENSPMSPPATHLTLGQWGGNRAQLVVGDSGTQVWTGCLFGDFDGNVPLDVTGHFAVNGEFTPYFLSPAMPAQLSGQVSGQSLTFAVAVYDTAGKRVLSYGPQVVVLGKQADIVICP